MLEWLKKSVSDFFAWLTSFPADFLKWAREVLDNWYKWVADVIKAVFKTVWDMFSDGVCYVIDKGLDIVKAGLDSVDVSALSGFADGLQLPSEIITVMQLSGVGTASGIIVTAIGIRLVLQLIPFTRLGS